MVDTLVTLRALLSNRSKRVISNSSYKKSAVLIPIYNRNGDYQLIFTQRTENLQYHKGQISFPGGRRDDSDSSPLATALRESYEEIGLNPVDVSIIGELDDITTLSSGYVISPFVGSIPYPYLFRPNSFEIERIIEVPLSFILDRRNWHQEEREWNGELVKHYYLDFKGDTIWGATGRILHHLLEILEPIYSPP